MYLLCSPHFIVFLPNQLLFLLGWIIIVLILVNLVLIKKNIASTKVIRILTIIRCSLFALFFFSDIYFEYNNSLQEDKSRIRTIDEWLLNFQSITSSMCSRNSFVTFTKKITKKIGNTIFERIHPKIKLSKEELIKLIEKSKKINSRIDRWFELEKTKTIFCKNEWKDIIALTSNKRSYFVNEYWNISAWNIDQLKKCINN